MTKPTVYPNWGDNLVVDPLTGAENKVQPTEEFKLSGLLRQEFLPRAYLNYQLDLINQWIMYFDKTTVYDLNSGTVIDRSNGYKQTESLGGNTTYTETLTEGEEVELFITYNGFTVTFPASFNFGDAGEPVGVSVAIIKGRKVGSTVYATTEWSQT